MSKSSRRSDKSDRKPARRSKKRGIANRQSKGLRRSSVSANKKNREGRKSWPGSKNVTHTKIRSNFVKSYSPTAIMKKKNQSQTKISSKILLVWACSLLAKTKTMTIKKARKQLRRL